MPTTRTPETGRAGSSLAVGAEYEASVAEALHVIATTCEEDFDGHTEFYRLSPAERLAWMESAVLLIESRRKVASSE